MSKKTYSSPQKRKESDVEWEEDDIEDMEAFDDIKRHMIFGKRYTQPPNPEV